MSMIFFSVLYAFVGIVCFIVHLFNPEDLLHGISFLIWGIIMALFAFHFLNESRIDKLEERINKKK